MMVNGTCVNTPTVPLNGTFAASLTGLFSLIAIIWLSQSMYKQRQFSKPKFLSIAVCFTDLMFAGISNSLLLASRWLGYCAMGGDTGCTIRGFCRSSIMVTAQMMVLFMTIERYIALRFPFRYQQLLPPRRILITTFSIYVYSILLSTLPFMGVNSYGYDYWCDFHWNDTSPAGRSFVFYILLQGTGCMLFTIFCNISVIYEVLAIKRRVDLANRKQSFKEEVEHIKFIIIMGLVSVLYIICTAPYLVRLACNQFGFDISRDKDALAVKLNIFNSMSNSYLILFIQVLFHSKVMEIIRACYGRSSEGNNTNHSEMHTSEVVIQ